MKKLFISILLILSMASCSKISDNTNVNASPISAQDNFFVFNYHGRQLLCVWPARGAFSCNWDGFNKDSNP